MKSLDPKTLELSKYWLKYVFFPLAGRGSVKHCRLTDKDGWTMLDNEVDEMAFYCKALYEEITERKWKDLDSALNYFSKYYFEYDKSDLVKNENKAMSSTFVANALAWMCKVNEIDWNDFTHTKQELEYFKKTILGKALWSFECFTSQYVKASSDTKVSQPKQPKPATSSTKSASTSSSGTNHWKSRGPLSSQVRDIVSVPGIKEYVQSSIIYSIDDIYVKGKKTRAFIRPLKPTGSINGTNKVYIGNSNNYEDCTCFFDNKAKAIAFLEKIADSGVYTGSLSVEDNRVDKNGYYEVNTELGSCLIRAFNLNEEVEAILEEDLEFSPEEKVMSKFEEFYSMLD